MVDLGGCPIAQCLVWPLVVIEVHVGINSGSGFTHALVGSEIHFFILDGPPQPLHEDVVQVPPFAVHADLDAPFQQQVRKGVAGELTPPSATLRAGSDRC